MALWSGEVVAALEEHQVVGIVKGAFFFSFLSDT